LEEGNGEDSEVENDQAQNTDNGEVQEEDNTEVPWEYDDVENQVGNEENDMWEDFYE